jgi:hypothetical protein
MVSSEATAIIAAGSAVGGGVIVAGSNYAVTSLQAREARRVELRSALIDLGDVVSRVDHRLKTEPEPGKTARWVNETMSKRAPQLEHAIGLARRRLIDPTLDELAASLSRALSSAMVLAPASLLPALEQLTDGLDGAEHLDAAWWERWNARGPTASSAAAKPLDMMSRRSPPIRDR